MTNRDSELKVVDGDTIARILPADLSNVMEIVADAYRAHALGKTVNPPSQFLNFPEHPNRRIISLPASVRCAAREITGLKWISSFPDNVRNGLPRASAVIILNG